MKTLIIGAGWAGLTAARMLAEAGQRVVVVEKSRGPGGRSSTRREGAHRFDHGAQYFTARDREFRDQVATWAKEGLVAPWTPRIRVFGDRGDRGAGSGGSQVSRWVGVPGMNAVCRHLAHGLDCRWQWRAAELVFDGAWQVTAESGERLEADHLVLTAPPAQAAALLGPDHLFTPDLEQAHLEPCLAAMLAFDAPLPVDFDAAFVNDQGPIAWLACNSSKPGRAGEDWVVHATAAWSREHLEAEFEAIALELQRALEDLVGANLPPPVLRRAHRWRYAMATDPARIGCLHHPEQRLIIAGDWCAGNRIEGAWLSGRAAAQVLA